MKNIMNEMEKRKADFLENMTKLRREIIRDSLIDDAEKRGEKIGISIGEKREREKTNMSIIKNMLKEKIDIETISRVTNVSPIKIKSMMF